MKYLSMLGILLLQMLLHTNSLKAQSWEVIIPETIIGQSTYGTVYPGPDNGVRLTVYDPFEDVADPIYTFDADGNYIGESSLNWTAEWDVLHSDKEGATYWQTYYKLRKVNAQHQIKWTYSPPVSAGIFWHEPAPNGGNCLQFSISSGLGQVIDYVNSNGLLVNRFVFPNGWPDEYHPGHDNSLIYTEDSFGPTTIHWKKVDQLNQIVWEIDLPEDAEFFIGSVEDGSSFYYLNGLVIKLDATGSMVWQKNLDSFYPVGDNFYPYDWLVREDGSLILIGSYSNFSAPGFSQKAGFINLNPVTGDLNWFKTVANSDNISYLAATSQEMPDGGILGCFSYYGNGVNGWEEFTLLVRTDANGNTLTTQIAGQVFRDQNLDCNPDATESPLKNVTIFAKSGTKTYSGTSNAEGKFEIPVSSGDYTLSINQPGSYWAYCNLPNPVHVEQYNDTVWMPVGARAVVDCPELNVSLGSPVFRRCFDNNYFNVQYQNYGTAPALNAYVTLTLDPNLIYLSSTAPLLSQNGQTYTFDIGTVDVGESGVFTVTFKVDCDVPLGEILCAESHIYPDTICIPTSPATLVNRFCLPVVASYDPNDKTAMVDGKPQTVKIHPDKSLEYLIRFQNTGNDTAFTVVVTDTLSALLDASTVVPGASSHPYTFQVRDGHVLQFTFPNILLPDSTTNEQASHGFVKFAIKQTVNNALGETLRNKAAIFFDYNDPVITNETALVISNAVGTTDPGLQLQAQTWPVPAKNLVSIHLPANAAPIEHWKLLDVNGRIVRSGKKEASTFLIQRTGLPAGLYWCQMVLTDGSVAFGRIVFE